jgi:hypothetical protein
MAIVLDQATVFNEFTTVIPAEIKSVLLPHIVGPQAELHLYSNPDEKPGIAVGAYNPNLATSYAWPSKESVDSLVDLALVQVFIESALLRYYQNLEGSGTTITPVALFLNRIIISGAVGFVTNGVSFPRLASLFDRDVQVGDIVMLKHLTTTFFTSVAGFVADVIPSVVAAATSDAANASTQVLASSTLQTAGTVNDITAVEAAGAYNGLPTGDINEIYTVTVIQGSTGGNATTALFSITSASGRDNVASIAPSAFAVATPVGTRGLTATWSNIVDDFVVGQVWTITVAQAFTKPVPTSAGTYTGLDTTTYIIEVTLGGPYTGPDPQITCTNAIATDSSGPTTVPTTATNVPVGTKGVLIQFSGTALRKGDKYYINVTAAGQGAFRTIVLNDNLPAALQVAPDMELDLHIQKNIEVPQERVSTPPILNWTDDQSGLVLNSGVDAYDATLTNGGVLFAVPVVSGPSTIVYISYRAWSTDWVNLVGQVQVPNGFDPIPIITAKLGTVSPFNPLAYAVYKAVLNSNQQPVSFSSVADPDSLSDWTFAATVLVGLPINSVTVLTHSLDVLQVFKQHVDDESSDIRGSWRELWFVPEPVVTLAIDDAAIAGSVILATLADNPGMTGTQYTYLTSTTGNAKFVTRGVRVGDQVRYLFSINGFGDTTYTTFTVAQVVNEDTLIFNLPGAGAAVGVPQKVEVWRNLTPTEQSNNIAALAASIKDKHVRLVFPAEAVDPTGVVDGFYLAAAVAGFTSGVCPHQGILNIPFKGFLGVPDSVFLFGNAQLNALSAAGVFIITQDSLGNVFVRNALTTDPTDPSTFQEVVVRNDDTIRHVLYNRVAQFFGVANITDAGIALVNSELQGGFQVLQGFTFINRLGTMITSGSVDSIRPSVVAPDTLIAQVTVRRPYPLDALQLNLIFLQTIITV